VLQYDFEESVGCWVTLTTHALRRALSVELAKENITLRQWEVLAWLSYQEDQSQVELAERLGIEAPTLAGIITRMERDGWLERTSCQKDRRKKRLRPTAQAEAVWNRMVECCGRVRERAIEGIPAEDLACLKRTCEALRKNLGDDAGVDRLAESFASAVIIRRRCSRFRDSLPVS
jgi:MarR family transcriptional regulator for hemolysin